MAERTKVTLSPRRLRQAQLWLAGVALLILAARSLPPRAYTKDLQQEYLAALAWRDGVDVFTPVSVLSARYFPLATSNFPHPSPYPPIVAALSLPLTIVPFPILVPLWLMLNVGLLVAIARRLGLSPLAGLALAAWPPIWWVLDIGQLEIVVLALLLLGWREAERGRAGRAGLWLGIAAALKLYPALFLLPFLVRRRFRLVATAGLVVALGQAGSLLVVGPSGMARYYRDVLPAVTGYYLRVSLNSSPDGALLRLLGGAGDLPPLVHLPTLVLPLAIGFAGLALLALLTLPVEVAPVAALVGMPNAWGYYAILALPRLTALLRQPALRKPTLAATAASSVTLLLLSATPLSGYLTPAAADVLLALQPAGYLGLLVLSFLSTRDSSIVERKA